MASSPQQVLRRFLAKGEIDRILRSFYMNVEQNQMSPWLQRVTMQALRKQGDLQALIWAEEVWNCSPTAQNALIIRPDHPLGFWYVIVFVLLFPFSRGVYHTGERNSRESV